MGLVVKENRGAASDNAVIFACDHGHFPLAMFAADRIRRTEPGSFDIVIAMPDISQVHASAMDGPTRICEIDISELPQVPMVKEWISFGTYFRWVLPSLFVDDYKAIFYLDTDTYLRRPGVQALFDSIDKPFAVSAVLEFQKLLKLNPIPHKALEDKIRDLGGANGEYYNAGVLVFQPEEFLLRDGLKRFQEAAVKNVEFLPVHRDQDQGAMNLAFADEIVPLNPLYNWRSRSWMTPAGVKEFNPFVLHFAGPKKPWDHHPDQFIASFTKEYLRYMSKEFPDFQPKIFEKSVAWRELTPKHKVKAFENVRNYFYRQRLRKKLTKYELDQKEEKYKNMRAAIAESVVG